ncbi:MAG: hypothetical protein ACREJR_00395, partial [Candidatus Rokuibacteriota bacterium]
LLGAASAGAVVGVAVLLESATEEEQIFGMAASRALLFMVVFVPINLVIVEWLTGLRLRAFFAMTPAPVASGVAALAVVWILREATAIESIAPIAGLVVAATLAAGTAVAVLLWLDPRSRGYVRGLRRGLASGRPVSSEPG